MLYNRIIKATTFLEENRGGGGGVGEEGDTHHAGLEGGEGGTGIPREVLAPRIARLC